MMLIQTVISCSTLSQEYCELIGLYWKLMRRQLWTLPPPTLTCSIKFCTYKIFGFIIRWTIAWASFKNRFGMRGILFICCCVCIRSIRTPGTRSICSLQQIRNIIERHCKYMYMSIWPRKSFCCDCVDLSNYYVFLLKGWWCLYVLLKKQRRSTAVESAKIWLAIRIFHEFDCIPWVACSEHITTTLL